jgi:hypothetical protein
LLELIILLLRSTIPFPLATIRAFPQPAGRHCSGSGEALIALLF